MTPGVVLREREYDELVECWHASFISERETQGGLRPGQASGISYRSTQTSNLSPAADLPLAQCIRMAMPAPTVL